MLLRVHIPLLLICCVSAGCGGSPKELPVAKSAHAGTMVTLPNGKGFAEVLVESESAGKRGAKAASKSRVIAYFYQLDGSSEMTPGPTEVKVKIGIADTSPVADLTPDPADPGKYASVPGDYPDGFAGQVEAKVNGEPVQLPVRIR